MKERFKLLFRISRGNSIGMLIQLLVYALVFVVLSTTTLVQASNSDFISAQGKRMVGCDVRVEISSGMLTEIQSAFLESLKQEGSEVNQYRQTAYFLHTEKGYDSFVLRFVDQNDIPNGYCILSNNAAVKLGLSKGDALTLYDEDIGLQVLSVEPLLTTDLTINNLGIIMLSNAIASLMKDGTGADWITGLRLIIQITAPEAYSVQETARLVDEVRSVFATGNYSPTTYRQPRVRDYYELLGDHKAFFSILGSVLNGLSLLSVLISALGIILIQRVESERRKHAYALLRAHGMTKRHTSAYIYAESLIVVIVSGILGISIGYNLYNSIFLRLTGLNASISLLSSAFAISVVKCVILIGFVALVCARSMVKSLFAVDIIVIRQRRKERKFSGAVQWIGWAFMFSVLLTIITATDWALNNLTLSLVFNIGCFFIAIALFAFIYGFFRLLIRLLAFLRFRAENRAALSVKLILSRRHSTALFCSTLALGLAMLLVFINLSQGLNAYFKNLWIGELKYSAAISTQSFHKTEEAQHILDEEGYAFDIIYRKAHFGTGMRGGTNAQPYYNLAVLRDNPQSGVELNARPGEFMASSQFMYLFQREIGQDYTFFNELVLPLTDTLNILYTTEIVSSFSFSVLLSYDDAGAYVDDTWVCELLLNVQPDSITALKRLAAEHGWLISTSEQYADTLRALYANYISLIMLVCTLVLLVVFVSIVSLTFVELIRRKHEFLIYRTFGASKSDVQGLSILENIWVAVFTSIVTGLLTALFFTQAFRLIVYNVAYTMPPLSTLGVFGAALAVIIGVTAVLVRTFDYGRLVDTLRAE